MAEQKGRPGSSDDCSSVALVLSLILQYPSSKLSSFLDKEKGPFRSEGIRMALFTCPKCHDIQDRSNLFWSEALMRTPT